MTAMASSNALWSTCFRVRLVIVLIISAGKSLTSKEVKPLSSVSVNSWAKEFGGGGICGYFLGATPVSLIRFASSSLSVGSLGAGRLSEWASVNTDECDWLSLIRYASILLANGPPGLFLLMFLSSALVVFSIDFTITRS